MAKNGQTSRRRVWWIAGGGVAVLLLALALRPRGVVVETAAVATGALEVTLDEEGMTRVRERFVVSAPVGGKVLRQPLEPGDPVVAGRTTLAVFQPSDPIPLDARSRAEAEAGVEAAAAALGRARALRQQAAGELDYARAETERYRELIEEGIVSQERLDQAELQERTRRESLEAADFAIRTAEGDLQVSRARLVQATAAQVGGGALTLVSPIDGVVLRVLRESEAVVPAGDPLVEVGDPRGLEIVADYLSSDAVRIEPGNRARVARWGGDALEAVVQRVEPAGFTKISALGVEEQRVNVVLDLVERPQQALGDGYRVEVEVIVWSGDEVLQVPVGAIFRTGGEAAEWAVYVVEDGAARLRVVQLGQRNDRFAQVLEGLAAGDRVILHAGDDVADGTRVTTAAAERPSSR
jgi:HlyD family secretion protein